MEEYLAYAIEGRRRVKEQLNKRKPDDEFANIRLGYLDSNGKLVVVWCPESQRASATQVPIRPTLDTGPAESMVAGDADATAPQIDDANNDQADLQKEPNAAEKMSVAPRERHYRIHYGATGHSYATIFGEYLLGAEEIVIEDPYIRQHHQIVNFLRFCETAVRLGKPKRVVLITRFDTQDERDEALAKLETIAESLKLFEINLDVRESTTLHDREVRLSNGWSIKIGRGFDIYQRPDDWLMVVGANDLDLRPCLETSVNIVRM